MLFIKSRQPEVVVIRKCRKTHQSIPKTAGTLDCVCRYVDSVIFCSCQEVAAESLFQPFACWCWPLNPTHWLDQTAAVEFWAVFCPWVNLRKMWLWGGSVGLWICAVGWIGEKWVLVRLNGQRAQKSVKRLPFDVVNKSTNLLWRLTVFDINLVTSLRTLHVSFCC